MKNTLAKFMRKQGLQTFTMKYYSPEVDAAWIFDDEGADAPSLQAVYKRSYTINGEGKKEEFWLYFSPEDAAAVGGILTAWASAHGEKI